MFKNASITPAQTACGSSDTCLRCTMNPGLPPLQTARLVGAMVSGQLWAGFGCHQVTWEPRLFSKPHQGGTLQFTPEPPPELGKRCHSSKTDADRRIQNKEGDRKSNHRRGDPQWPLCKKSGFVLIIHVQGGLECGEFTFIRQAPRGQRAALKEVATWRRDKKDRSLGHQASTPHTSHVAWRKEGELSSKHHISQICVYSLGSCHEKNAKNSVIPQFKPL